MMDDNKLVLDLVRRLTALERRLDDLVRPEVGHSAVSAGEYFPDGYWPAGYWPAGYWPEV